MGEILSGFLSAPVGQGMLKLQPNRAKDFARKYDSKQSVPQKILGVAGRMLATGSTSEYQLKPAIPPRQYQPHNCWPWVPCQYQHGHPPPGVGFVRVLDTLRAQTSGPLPAAHHEGVATASGPFSVRLPGVFFSGDQSTSGRRQSCLPAESSRSFPILQPVIDNSAILPFRPPPVSSLYAPPSQPPLPADRASLSGTSARRTKLSTSSEDLIYIPPVPVDGTDLGTSHELVSLQGRLERELQRYRDRNMLLGQNGNRRINPFSQGELVELLADIVCDVDMPVLMETADAAKCLEFVLILSTVEGVIGDLSNHCVKLEPFLANKRLKIYVCREQHVPNLYVGK